MTPMAQKRAKMMEMLKLKKFSFQEAGKLLKITVRQVKRIYKEYLEKGDISLNHGLIGGEGNHRVKEGVKETALKLYRERYPDFGPTFASEKMEEEFGLKVNHETLRLWLKKEGEWTKHRKRTAHRSRRTRRSCFGAMLQMDGSIHDWFENGTEVCLMDAVDDGTGKGYGLFDTGETTDVALRVLYDWINKYGIPQSVYSDRKSLFYTERVPNIQEQLDGVEPLTEFGKVCKEMGIEMIFAYSPQAKGRVERRNGVLQDRLIKEIRLRGIKDIAAANRFLKEEYWDKFNDKFEKTPASEEDAHVALLPSQNIDELISYTDFRTLTNDYVVRYENRFFQIVKGNKVYVFPRYRIKIKEWLDKSIHLYYNRQELIFREIFLQNAEDTRLVLNC
jgi:transposase